VIRSIVNLQLLLFSGYQNVNAITIDDIKNTANKLLTGENVVTAILYPEKK